MMSPAAPVKLHRIKNDQLYHHYLGDPIEVLMLHDDGTHTLRHGRIGPPRGPARCSSSSPATPSTPRTSVGQRRWFLGASTEWPGVVPTEDVELGDADALAAKHPDVAAEIRSFPVPAS